MMTFVVLLLAAVHGALARSEPAKGARLEEVPGAIRLTFTESPELPFTHVSLLGPDSSSIELGPLRLEGARTVVADVRGPLVAGSYAVAWQMAGADGHPVRGRYSFSILPGARGLLPPMLPGDTTPRASAPAVPWTPPVHDAPSAERESADAASPTSVIVRWIGFVALVTVLGVVAFHWAVLGVLRRRASAGQLRALSEVATRRAAGLGVAATLALLAAALARLALQTYAMRGASDAGAAAMLWSTTWGRGWLLHVLAAAVTLAGLLLAPRNGRTGWGVALLGALLLAFTPALTGHAVAAPHLGPIAIAADGLHVLGAGGWMGSLLAMVTVGIPVALAQEEPGRTVADLVNAFSPTALCFASLLALTGLVAAWIHLGSIPALWESTYGRVLLVKLAVLAAAAGAGAFNWLRVRPALGDLAGARRVRRSAAAELGLAALILLVTAVLVATSPPAAADEHGPRMTQAADDAGRR